MEGQNSYCYIMLFVASAAEAVEVVRTQTSQGNQISPWQFWMYDLIERWWGKHGSNKGRVQNCWSSRIALEQNQTFLWADNAIQSVLKLSSSHVGIIKWPHARHQMWVNYLLMHSPLSLMHFLMRFGILLQARSWGFPEGVRFLELRMFFV